MVFMFAVRSVRRFDRGTWVKLVGWFCNERMGPRREAIWGCFMIWGLSVYLFVGLGEL